MHYLSFHHFTFRSFAVNVAIRYIFQRYKWDHKTYSAYMDTVLVTGYQGMFSYRNYAHGFVV